MLMHRVGSYLFAGVIIAVSCGCSSSAPNTASAHPKEVPPTANQAVVYDLDDEIDRVGVELLRQAEIGQEANVAVLPLTSPPGNVTNFGVILAEKLAHALVIGKRCRVADRAHVNAVLAEKDFASSGLTDASSVGHIAKLMSVQYIITGTTVDAGSRIEVIFKLLVGATGQQAGSISVNIPKNDEVLSLLYAGPSTWSPTRTLSFDSGNASNSVSVIRENEYLVVSAIGKGTDDLARLQAARQKSRDVYADYVLANITSTMERQHLLRYARDMEEIVDARQDGDILQLVVRFPLPKER